MRLKFSIFLLVLGAALVLIACQNASESTTSLVSEPQPTRTLSREAAAIATINAAPPLPDRSEAAVEVAAADRITVSYDPALIAEGEAQFMLCAACHGADATGVQGLGKDLVHSDFLRGLTDDEAVNFIVMGRPIWDAANTTGIDMPPKGGNPALTTEQIYAIVAYLRSLDPAFNVVLAAVEETTSESAEVAIEPTAMSEPTEQAVVVAEVEQPAEEAAPSASDVEHGATLYVSTCSACHGMDATGIQGLGKDLVDSDFIHGLTDTDLLTFIKAGRPMWDAANTTGVDMPPKGGNPMLTDEDILAIIAYLRSLAIGG